MDQHLGVVGLSQTWNRYAYARGNPATYFDPTGMKERKNTTHCEEWEACSGGREGQSGVETLAKKWRDFWAGVTESEKPKKTSKEEQEQEQSTASDDKKAGERFARSTPGQALAVLGSPDGLVIEGSFTFDLGKSGLRKWVPYLDRINGTVGISLVNGYDLYVFGGGGKGSTGFTGSIGAVFNYHGVGGFGGRFISGYVSGPGLGFQASGNPGNLLGSAASLSVALSEEWGIGSNATTYVPVTGALVDWLNGD